VFIELVDALRCPAEHEESHLIASATRMASRHILDGELGCPVCHARYPIVDGEARFTPSVQNGRGKDPAAAASDEDGLRCAALLGLDGPGGFAILDGHAARFAGAVAAIVGDVPLMLVNPPAGINATPGVSVVRTGEVLPLAAATVRAAATGDADERILAELARVLRDGGRLVAPASAGLPAGVRQLARDDRDWVGEKLAPPNIVSIGRGTRT